MGYVGVGWSFVMHVKQVGVLSMVVLVVLVLVRLHLFHSRLKLPSF